MVEDAVIFHLEENGHNKCVDRKKSKENGLPENMLAFAAAFGYQSVTCLIPTKSKQNNLLYTIVEHSLKPHVWDSLPRLDIISDNIIFQIRNMMYYSTI